MGCLQRLWRVCPGYPSLVPFSALLRWSPDFCWAFFDLARQEYLTERVRLVRKTTRELLEENQPTLLVIAGTDELAGLAEDLNALGERGMKPGRPKNGSFPTLPMS